MPDLREKLALQGMIPESSTPEQLSTLVKDDLARWAKVARQAGVRLD
jgi:tripartite-type tricarboxylate transporter receptor subunit TctC